MMTNTTSRHATQSGVGLLLLLMSISVNAEQAVTEQRQPQPQTTLKILGGEVKPGQAKILDWVSSQSFSGRNLKSPVTIVRGHNDGPVLCLVAAIHGDELNGVEIVRRVSQGLDPATMNGTVISIPIVNVFGLASNSRYLPDRRDLNRFFPGDPEGSAASRIAYSLFTDLISYCGYLIDFHTGSFKRSNIPQLRADMSNPQVTALVTYFDSIVVLHKTGHAKTLRAAASQAGIPAVTFELGRSGTLQAEHVEAGIVSVTHVLNRLGITSNKEPAHQSQEIFYTSRWIRANNGGILFSEIKIGEYVKAGDLLGTLVNPLTNIKFRISAPESGRVLGMALNQFVLPGYAAYHLGVSTDKNSMSLDTSVSEDEDIEIDDELD